MYRIRTTFAGTAITGAASSSVYFDATAGTAQQAATAVSVFWDSAQDVMHTSTTISNETEVATVDSTNGDIQAVAAVTQWSLAGLDSSAANAPQIQGVARFRTGEFILGREVRGRIFIPSLGQGSFSVGGWNATKLTTLNAACAALVAAANCSMVIWHRPQWDEGTPHTAEPDRPGSFKEVTSGTMWTKTGVLRSRRD